MQRYRDLKIGVCGKESIHFLTFHEIGNSVNANSVLGNFKYFFSRFLFNMVSLIITIILQGVPINTGIFSDEFDIVFLNNSLI